MGKKIREVLLVALVLCFCISHAAFAQAEKPIPNYQIIENITPEKAYSLIQSYREGCPGNRENFVVIDVRTPEEYANGYIENAINLDYYSETFKDDLNTRTVIGSTTKTPTAVIIMRVVEEGEISLMDTLDREFTL